MKWFKKAVLVIHGFTAGLSDNEFLVNELETDWRYDVYAWTLPAHEKHIMTKVKYTDWIKAVEEQIEFLLTHGYKKIYVIGHSMGGLLAGYLATKYKEIKKVVLLAPAYDYFSKDQYRKDFSNFGLLNKDAGYRHLLFKAFKAPLPTLLEFRKLVAKYKDTVTQIQQECLVLQGDADEVVPYTVMQYVKENIGSKNAYFTTVKGGRHVLVRGSCKNKVIPYIHSYLRGGRKWKQMRKSEI